MSEATVDFYFDLISPYSYLAHHRLKSLESQLGVSILYHPVDVVQIKHKARNTGPRTKEMPLKHAYARIDLQRWAARYGVTLIPVTSYDAEMINKGVFFAEDRGYASNYVTYAWKKTYSEGNAINEKAVLADIADCFGWNQDEFFAYIKSDDANTRFEEANQRAHERGVFGVPTMLFDSQIWWGNDRLDFMEEHIRATLQAHRERS